MKRRILVCILAFVMIFALAAMTACGTQGEKGDKGEPGATGATGATGAAGADGADGADGKDGVGIASVEIKDGKLVIVYTDDNVVELELGLPSDEETVACEHANVTYGELVNAPHSYDAETKVVTPGKYVAVCSDCGNAEIVEGVHHNNKLTPVAATCTTEAFEADVCTVCGMVDDATKVVTAPAKGHNIDVTYPIYKDYYVCDNGGVVFEFCKDCDYSTNTYYAADAIDHYVTKWNVSANVVAVGTINATGVCEHCTKSMTLSLPGYNSNKYTAVIDATVRNCQAPKGTGTYTTYVATNGDVETLTNEKVEGYVKIEFTTDLKAGAHTLNGELQTTETVARGTEGVTLFANTPVTCELNGSGYYNCEVCDALITVSVAAGHVKGEVTTVKAPTCVAYGTEKYTCIGECKKEITDDKVPMVVHSYTVTKIVADTNGKTSTLVLACTVCPAGDYLENVVKYETVASTCTTKGSISYTYVEDEEEKNGVLELPTVGHSLNGVVVTGKVLAGTKGVAEFANKGATCAKDGDAYFTCDNCAKPVSVVTYVAHTYTEIIKEESKPATCTEAGYDVAYCTVCKVNVKVAEYDAGHDVKYTYAAYKNPVDGVIGTLTEACTKCADLTVVYPVTVKNDAVVANCVATGLTIYTVIVKDEGTNLDTTAVIEVVEDKTFHTLNGDFVNDKSPVNIDEVKGITEFANNPATCVKDKVGAGMFDCEFCGVKVSVSIVKNHNVPANADNTTPATCEKDGQITGNCTVCGDADPKTLKATGHKYTYTYDAKAEQLVFTCSVCDAKDSCCKDKDGKALATACANSVVKVSVKNGNDFRFDKNGKVQKTEPTCAADGVIVYTWTVDYATIVANAQNNGAGIAETFKVVATYEVADAKLGHPTSIPKDAEVIKWSEIYTVEVENEDGEKVEVTKHFDYEGYRCEDCGKVIVTKVTEVVADAEENV